MQLNQCSVFINIRYFDTVDKTNYIIELYVSNEFEESEAYCMLGDTTYCFQVTHRELYI